MRYNSSLGAPERGNYLILWLITCQFVFQSDIIHQQGVVDGVEFCGSFISNSSIGEVCQHVTEDGISSALQDCIKDVDVSKMDDLLDLLYHKIRTQGNCQLRC